MRDGWRALLAAWQQGAVDPDRVRYDVEERAKLEGWSSSLVRTLLDCYRPILEVKPAFGVRAPAMREDLTLGEMVHVGVRSEEHTSELQSLMRISYAGFCLKKKNKTKIHKEQRKIHY